MGKPFKKRSAALPLEAVFEYTTATPVLARAARQGRSLGPDTTSTLQTVNNLGSLYQAQGRLAEAEALYSRALQGFKLLSIPLNPILVPST